MRRKKRRKRIMREKPKAVLTTNKPYKDEFLAQMNWIEKEKTRNCSAADISISIQQKRRGLESDNGKCICITFRNGVEKKISSTEYVQICIHKNRCFFRGTDSQTGYKISQINSESKNRYCKMSHVESAKDFIGDYDLQYDEFLELYYVEKRGN